MTVTQEMTTWLSITHMERQEKITLVSLVLKIFRRAVRLDM